MQPLDLLILALAVFYAAHALANTHGPFGSFEYLRARLPLGGVTSCTVCLSPWFAALFYVVLQTGAAWLVWLFAAAGGSVFLYRWTGGDHV